MRKALLPDTPEVKNWVREILHEGGTHLYPVEGYSVKDESVTALFERRISTVGIKKWSEDEVSEWLETKEDERSWLARLVLAKSLSVPLYLILWQEKREVFRNFSVTLDRANQIEVVDEVLFKSCKDFARWIADLKGIRVSKGFVEQGRLSLIDKCLRLHRVPWPGNLDGFLLGKTKRKVKAIFEFSRTRKYPVKTHDLNRYFSYDIIGGKLLIF